MERLGCFNTPMWIEWQAEYPTMYFQMARAWSVEWSVRVFSCRFFMSVEGVRRPVSISFFTA